MKLKKLDSSIQTNQPKKKIRPKITTPVKEQVPIRRLTRGWKSLTRQWNTANTPYSGRRQIDLLFINTSGGLNQKNIGASLLNVTAPLRSNKFKFYISDNRNNSI